VYLGKIWSKFVLNINNHVGLICLTEKTCLVILNNPKRSSKQDKTIYQSKDEHLTI